MYQAITIKLVFVSLLETITSKNISKKIISKLNNKFFLNKNIYFFQSGRSALGYILEQLPKKKYIMVPSYSCEVVPLEVKKRGFEPLYYELNPNSNNIKDILTKIKFKNTAAIIFQHSFGIHKNISLLKKTLNKKKILLIEDKALCFLSKNKNLPELQGDVAYYSFESSKTITCTMGGMIYFDNKIFNNIINYKNNLFYNFKTNLRVLFSVFLYKIPGDLGFAIRKFFLILSVIKPSVSTKDYNIKLNKNFYDLTNFQKTLLLNQLKNMNKLKKNSIKNIEFWSEVLNFDFKKIFKKDYLPLRLYYYSKNSKKIKRILQKNGLKQEDWFLGGMGDIGFDQKSVDYNLNEFKKTKDFCNNNVNLPSIILIKKSILSKIKKEIKNLKIN
jgi:dTDP-4-amino-4,6-dideoxygalactose transaminase